jgi:O-antigen/teichoic acid export membrane protein
MSRLNRFKHSLISGYVMLAANIFYTFLSVPLALSYLTLEQFGLWALIMQISGYIGLIDAGMSGSISRVLIDHKDKPESGEYGSIIKTGALVGIAQGVIVLLAGTALAFPLGEVLKVPPELRHDLQWLIIGQAAILCFSFITRILNHVLVAHQRYDISNYGYAIVFVFSLFAMWAGFSLGWGVFAFLAAQVGGAIIITIVQWASVIRLKLLPDRGAWGKASGRRFKELFSYGKDLFLYLIGMQVINASQTILLTRFMGLGTAALWTIATRCYNMVSALIWRTQEYSGPPLAEMYVRGEHDRMRDRLRDVAFFTTNVSILAGVALAVCNNTFMQLWTAGKMEWLPINDLLLGVWLVALTMMRGHIGLAGALKRFGFFSYIFLIEGALFFGLNILLRKVDGITRLLALSILCTLALSLPYALARTRRYFKLTGGQLAAWYGSSWRFGWRIVLVGCVTYFATQRLEAGLRLGVNATVCAVIGGYLLTRYGMGRTLQNDIAGKLPSPMRRILLGVTAT